MEKNNLGVGEGYFEQVDEEKKPIFEQWGDDDQYHVIKMHGIDPVIMEMVSRGKARILYIYRDIRDVAVSAKSIFHLNDENELLRALDTSLETFNKLKSVNGILWQRYESVMADLPGAVKELAKYANIQVAEEVINDIANSCSMENVVLDSKYQRMTAFSWILRIVSKLRLISKNYDSDKLLHPGHISKNKGAVGQWRTELNAHEISTITERYKTWLQDEGYIEKGE